jgi:hypothetical protein
MDNLNRGKPHNAHTNRNRAKRKCRHQAPDLALVELKMAQQGEGQRENYFRVRKLSPS